MQTKFYSSGKQGRLDFTHTMRNQINMPLSDSRNVLWRNISALMHKRYGREHITKLAADTGLSLATISRIKDQETSIGVLVLDSIARAMGISPMQLLNPEFDPYKTQEGENEMFSPLATDLAVQLDSVAEPLKRERAYVLATQVLTEAAAATDKSPLRALKSTPARAHGR